MSVHLLDLVNPECHILQFLCLIVMFFAGGPGCSNICIEDLGLSRKRL